MPWASPMSGGSGERWSVSARAQVVDLYQYLEVSQRISITEEDMLAHFKATNRDRALRISGILLATREEADGALKELADGADFGQLATERTLYDPLRDSGGDSVEYLLKDGTIEALHPIFSLAVGETSQPLPLPYKGATHFVIIRITDEIPVAMRETAQRVRGELFEIKKKQRQQALLDSLLAAYSPRQDDGLHALAAQVAADGQIDLSSGLDRTLSVYKGGRLTFGDFTTLVPEAHLTPEFLSKPNQLEDLLSDRALPAHLYIEEVRLKTGGKQSPRIEALVAKKRDDLLLSTVHNRAVDETIPLPSIEEAKAYYESHPEKFQTVDAIAIAEILVAFRELAQELRDQLEAGEAHAEDLARMHSIRAGPGHHGGRLELRRQSRYPVLYEAASEMEVGQVAGPVRVEQGFSVFQVRERRRPETKPFDEESQRRSKAYLRVEEVRRGYVEYVRGLRQKYGTKTYADFGENYHGFRSKITTHSERSDAGCLIIVKW